MYCTAEDVKNEVILLIVMSFPPGLTLCFSRQIYGSFYLCRVCEENCPPELILNHLSSIDHCRNYFVSAEYSKDEPMFEAQID